MLHRPHNPLHAALLVGLLAVFAAAAQQAPQKPAPQPPAGLSTEELEKELALAAEQFLNLLESGEPEKFPEFCSEDGVVFGLDPSPVPLKEIREQIEKRTGVYCALFDTTCLRKEAAAQNAPKSELAELFALRERLRTAAVREARVELTAIEDFWVGDLRLELKGPPDAGAPGWRKVIDFSFERNDGVWRLMAVSIE